MTVNSADTIIVFKTITGSEFTIRYNNLRPTVFCLSVHKAGSVLMAQIISEIANAAQLPLCNFDEQLFSNGVSADDLSIDSLSAFNQIGMIYNVTRDINRVRLIPNFWTARKLALVRDPRDIAVSFYFSMMRSHALPLSQRDSDVMSSNRARYQHLSVSDYVLNGHADMPIRNMQSYVPLLEPGSNCLFYKYEEIIFEKRNWTSSLADNLSAKISEDLLNSIADKYDIRPDDCDSNRHIRRVTPGDYKNHLNKDAIEYLQIKFFKVFSAFDYKPD